MVRCGCGLPVAAVPCFYCRREDIQRLIIDLGLKWPNPEIWDDSQELKHHSRRESLKRAGEKAGRRTTVKAYVKRGATILRLMRQGLPNHAIWKEMISFDPHLQRQQVDNWVKKYRRNGDDSKNLSR